MLLTRIHGEDWWIFQPARIDWYIHHLGINITMLPEKILNLGISLFIFAALVRLSFCGFVNGIIY